MNDEMNENFDGEQETVVVKKEDLQIQPKPNRKVQSGMFGIPEYIGLGLGLLSLLGVLFFYFFIVSPAKSDLAGHKEQRDKLEKEKTDAEAKFGNITTTEGKVTELVNSVDSFERNYLPFADVGKAGLYQRINNMISAYGLTNVSGPDYTPLEINDKQQSTGGQNEKQGGRDKLRSLFPGIYISITLEGDYQNLRKFIREMESSNQFVVVNTVELEGAEAKEQREQKQNQQQTKAVQLVDINGNPIPTPTPKPTPKPTPIPPKGKTHGEIVSLRIEMAAYFRRNNIPNVVNSEVKQ